MMQVIRSSESSVLTRAIRCHNTQVGILDSNRREYRKSCIIEYTGAGIADSVQRHEAGRPGFDYRKEQIPYSVDSSY
jgi:hypothetical protein